MKIKPKKFTNLVLREGHWMPDREGYFTMEKNERVDDFSRKVMKKLSKEIKSFDIRTYPDTFKIYNKVAKWLNIKPKNLLLAEGADGGLLRVFNVFVGGGDKVITLNPSYAMYPMYCQMFGAKHYPINLKFHKKFDYFKELKKKIIKIKPRLLSIANPNQPIEVLLNLKQISSICKLAKRYNTIVAIDEAYYHFCKVTAKKLINKHKNLIVIRTFSKAFGLAGLRIGYTIADKTIIQYMMSIKTTYEINSVNMKFIKFFLNNIKIMQKYVSEVKKSRKFMQNFVKENNLKIFGKYSNRVLIKVKNFDQAQLLHKKLYKKKFIVRPWKIDSSSYIACTLGSLKIMKKFSKEFKKILNI